MRVTFCGVRGSIPAPGAEFIKYGGNTACVHVELSDGTDIILDAGTGIRGLGKRLLHKTTPIYLLLSHNHWDHIQGFPFFAPIFQASRDIYIVPGLTELNEPDAILNQMVGSLFPVQREQLLANIVIDNKPAEVQQWQIASATITRAKMNHPGGGSCYHIQEGEHSIAYITDNELYPPYKKVSDFLDFVAFAKNVDLLIHDAQYLISDMPTKSGWGHSVAEEAVKLAMACNVKQLALYSHDPERTDEDIDTMIEHCQALIGIGGLHFKCMGAAEDLTVTLGG